MLLPKKLLNIKKANCQIRIIEAQVVSLRFMQSVLIVKQIFRMSRAKFHPGGVPGLGANVAGRSGDPARRGGEGKLELTETPQSKTVAEGIPEGFRPAASARVALVGARAAEPWHTCVH